MSLKDAYLMDHKCGCSDLSTTHCMVFYGIAWYCVVFHCCCNIIFYDIAWYFMVLRGIALLLYDTLYDIAWFSSHLNVFSGLFSLN